MIKFSDFISEKYAAKGRKKEWELMIDWYMPLTPSILKDFEIFVPEAYHVTSIASLKNTIKIQGKKVDLPTFTRGSRGLSKGAIETAEVLLKVEGYSSFSADEDFESTLDRNGHRWLHPLKDEDYVVNNKFSTKIAPIIVKKYNLDNRYSVPNMVKAMNGKEKGEFVKFYYEEAKKLITKSLIDDIKDSISRSYAGAYDNNEILLHNFKIKEIKVVDNGDEHDVEENIQKILDMGIDIQGTITKHEIENIGRK